MNNTQPHIGLGVFLPEHILDNEELERLNVVLRSGKKLTAELIRKKIGVERRHIAAQNETVADMGYKAAVAALGDRNDVDQIIVSTSHPTPNHVAREIRDRLDIKAAEVLDIHAACTGSAAAFAYLHEKRDKLNGKNILIVATEKFSHSVVNLLRDDAMELDRSLGQTIFGDGAAALSFTLGKDLLIRDAFTKELVDPAGKTDLIFMAMGNNTFVEPCFVYPVARSSRHKDFPEGYFTQDGPGVFTAVQSTIPAIVRDSVQRAGFTPKDIDLVVFHPGSKRMADALQESLQPDFQTYSDYLDGNMSSVSLLYSFIKAIQEKIIGSGSRVVLSGFGAGSPHLYSSTVIIEIA